MPIQFQQLAIEIMKVAENGFDLRKEYTDAAGILRPETPRLAHRVGRLEDKLQELLTPAQKDNDRIWEEMLEISGAVACQLVEREYPETCYVIEDNGDERFSEEAQDAFNHHQEIIEGALVHLIDMVRASFTDRYIVNPVVIGKQND